MQVGDIVRIKSGSWRGDFGQVTTIDDYGGQETMYLCYWRHQGLHGHPYCPRPIRVIPEGLRFPFRYCEHQLEEGEFTHLMKER